MKIESVSRLISRPFLILTVLVGIIFAFSYRALLVSQPFAFGDLTLFPENLGKAAEIFVSPWNPTSLGHFEPSGPIQLLMGFAVLLFGPGLSQKLALLLPGPVSAFSMYFLSKNVSRHSVSRIIVGIMYGTTTWMFGEILGGGWSLMWVYALSPILILLWLRSQRTNSLVDFLVVLGLSGVLYAIHQHAIFIVGPFVLSFVIVALVTEPKQRLIAWARFVTWILVSLLFYLPYFDNASYFLFLSRTATGPLSSSGLSGLGLSEIVYTYQSLSNVFDLVLLHIVIFPLAFAAIFLARKEIRPIVAVFSAITGATLAFLWLTANGYTIPLFQRFTVLFVFENPVKPMVILFLAALPLVAITVDRIYDTLVSAFYRIPAPGILRTRQWTFRFAAMLIISISLLSLFSMPVFRYMQTGDASLYASRGPSFMVPDDVQKVSNWLNYQKSQQGFFRTFWLPQTPDVMLPAFTIDPYTFALTGGANRYGLPSVDYVRFVLTHFVSADTNQTSYLLGQASVRYAIVDTLSSQAGPPTVAEYSDSFIAVGKPSDLETLLRADAGMHFLSQIGRFHIYVNDNFIPRFTAQQPLSAARFYNESITWHNTTESSFAFDSPNSLMDWKLYTQDEVSLSNLTSVTPPNSVVLENLRGGGQAGGWVTLSRTLSVHAGDNYRVSYWIKNSNVQGSHLKVIFYPTMNTTNENDAIFQTTFAPAVSGTSGWNQVTGFVTVPKAAVRMDLVGLGGWQLDISAPAFTWFDSISVEKGHFQLVPIGTTTPVMTTGIGPYTSPGKYTVQVTTPSTSTLVFAESFDARWIAVVRETGQSLSHIPAYGWANGFIVDHPGSWTIQIILNGQLERDVSLAVWMALWSLLGLIAIIRVGIAHGALSRLRQSRPL